MEIVDHHQEETRQTKRMLPVRPGEILGAEFRTPLGSTPDQLARGKRRATAGTALRLARHIGATAKSWLNLQPSLTWT